MAMLVLVAHGELAKEMKNSAEMIAGELPEVKVVNFYPSEGFDSLKSKIEQTVSNENDILVLADLFGGSPFNAACAVLLEKRESNIEVVSGMSLPLVLEAMTQMNILTSEKLKNYLVKMGSDTVREFNEVLEEEDELD